MRLVYYYLFLILSSTKILFLFLLQKYKFYSEMFARNCRKMTVSCRHRRKTGDTRNTKGF